MPIDGEIVLAANLDDAVRKPAPVHGRQPAGGVVVTLVVAVETRFGQSEIEQVRRETPTRAWIGGAQPAVVRLGASDDMLDVGLAGVGEVLQRIGAIDASSSATISASTDWG